MDPTGQQPARAVPGATSTTDGTLFTLVAPEATGVELCLFDQANGRETRIALARDATGAWSAAVPGVGHGQLYGYRAHGPYDPPNGYRFNPAKLLIDPRARAIAGTLEWSDLLHGYRDDSPDLPDPRDSAPAVPKSIVMSDRFDWQGDRHPETPWERTVIYECHVRGMTHRHPGVPDRLRGTYLGLAAEPVVEHLLSLGVTAVQLLPIHHHTIDRRLAHLGLTNYWGYNTIGYFAPDCRFATGVRGEQVDEFRTMVRGLHAAGIEVLLDVVYNHTGEGDAQGPTLAFRGLDNRGYYRLDDADLRKYVDHTGVGNTLHAGKPASLSLILESLRYWVRDMHVDGFRFDLATSLGREGGDFDPSAAFFDAVQNDPVISKVKLIAEPWDLGPEGYRLGQFPAGWAEWNDRFRDAARRYWAGLPDRPGELAKRLAGSGDIFPGRAAQASVNFITCHDGFTLRDLVSYERKHNEPNGEENRDGHHDNLSRSWGVEGPTADPEIRAARMRASKALFATLALAHGVPMISHGDEIGRTQLGNNNAYCQDSALTWIDWSSGEPEWELLDFVRAVFRIRAAHPAYRLSGFDQIAAELDWVDAGGAAVLDDASLPRAFGFLLSGSPRLLVLMNGEEAPRRFVLPPDGPWQGLLPGMDVVHDGEFELESHGIAVFESANARGAD